MPTTILKSLCSTDTRGRYDLTKCGLSISPLDLLVSDHDDCDEDDVPEEVVEPPKRRKKKVIEDVPQIFHNPVYVVTNLEGSVSYGVTDNPTSAYEMRTLCLHDNGTVSLREAISALEKKHYVIIKSNCSQLHCLIEKFDLNQ